MTLQYQLYRDLQNNIKDPVRVSQENTHSAPQIQHSKNEIKNNLGWRMAKGNYGLHQGSWYLEVVLKSGTARLGFSQISADLQAYPGYDCFGYGFDSDGALYHQAIGRKTLSSKEGFKEGDVVGMLLKLPKEYSSEEVEILESRKWDPSILYAPQSVNEKEVEIWKKDASIIYFVNGREVMGFKMIFLGRYYPTFGMWANSSVEVNCGPKFKYPMPLGAKPYSESINAPICVGEPYNPEEIMKLLQERQAAIQAAANNPKPEDDMSSDEKMLKVGDVPPASPIRIQTMPIVSRSPANRLKRKGLGIDTHSSPQKIRTPERKTHSAHSTTFNFSPLRASQSPRAVRASFSAASPEPKKQTFADDQNAASITGMLKSAAAQSIPKSMVNIIHPLTEMKPRERTGSADSMSIDILLNSEDEEVEK